MISRVLIFLIIIGFFSCEKYVYEPKIRCNNSKNLHMAERFRYFIDIGSGYQSIEVYDNNLNLDVFRSDEISYLLKNQQLRGSIKIKGDDAETVFSSRTTGYYKPFKVESFNGSIWSTLVECNADIRGEYLFSQKILTIDNFDKGYANHDKLIADYDVKYNVLDFSPALTKRTIIKGSVTSTSITLISPAVSVNWATYQTIYDIFGRNTGKGDPYDRFNYMRLKSSTGTAPNIKHTYQVMIFENSPGVSNTHGYLKIPWTIPNAALGQSYSTLPILLGGLDTEYWAKLPTAADQTETFNANYSENCYKASDILNYIVSSLDVSLEFDENDAGDAVLIDDLYIGSTNELVFKPIESLNLSLKDILGFMKYYGGANWFIDSGKLKFERQQYTYYTSSLDWSSEISNVNIEKAYDNMPDAEIFAVADKHIPPFFRSYYPKGVVTDGNIFDYSIDFYHDIEFIFENQSNLSDEIFFSLFDGSSVIVRDNKYFNELNPHSYSEYPPYYAKGDPSEDYGIFRPDLLNPRPLWKKTHQKAISDWADFDLFSLITGLGYLDNYTINLKTNSGTFEGFNKQSQL